MVAAAVAAATVPTGQAANARSNEVRCRQLARDCSRFGLTVSGGGGVYSLLLKSNVLRTTL
jgi:hypothetical protein